MNNLSLQITFVFFGLNMIATSIEAPPPDYAQKFGGRKLLNLTKKTQEPQKASPCSSPPSTLLPRDPIRGGGFGRGHLLLILAAIILMVISYIFETLQRRCKKFK